jgi:DNA-binding IclR family transcriptional regulator
MSACAIGQVGPLPDLAVAGYLDRRADHRFSQRNTGRNILTNLCKIEGSEESGLASVDLVLSLIELLAEAPRPCRLTEIARDLGISKARAHRHLRSLMKRGYVRQDAESERYEIAIKLMTLGDAVRERFDLLAAMRPQMSRLREQTSQTVTASAFIDGAVVVLEFLHGRNLIEFGVKPGARLDYHATAHGLLALAFGPPELLPTVAKGPLKAWTSATITSEDGLVAAVEQVRRQGWASAPDQLMLGVNALAAPVFDHRGDWCGGLALVGSAQFITDPPAQQQLDEVLAAAAAASGNFVWKVKVA